MVVLFVSDQSEISNHSVCRTSNRARSSAQPEQFLGWARNNPIRRVAQTLRWQWRCHGGNGDFLFSSAEPPGSCPPTDSVINTSSVRFLKALLEETQIKCHCVYSGSENEELKVLPADTTSASLRRKHLSSQTEPLNLAVFSSPTQKKKMLRCLLSAPKPKTKLVCYFRRHV